MPKSKNARKNDSKEQENAFTDIKVRLDAVVLLLLTSRYSDDKGNVKISEVAPLLHAAGYSPTEIAKLLGKEKATQVAPYLYPKK